jgi:hypothetical protein
MLNLLLGMVLGVALWELFWLGVATAHALLVKEEPDE